MSPCFDSEDEFRADQDSAPELNEYTNIVFSRGDNMDPEYGDRITNGNGNDLSEENGNKFSCNKDEDILHSRIPKLWFEKRCIYQTGCSIICR